MTTMQADPPREAARKAIREGRAQIDRFLADVARVKNADDRALLLRQMREFLEEGSWGRMLANFERAEQEGAEHKAQFGSWVPEELARQILDVEEAAELMRQADKEFREALKDA
jgi:hypothetical protein